jgi:competence protein ComEA
VQVAWKRESQIVLLILCLAAGAALLGGSAARPTTIADDPPVFPARAAQAAERVDPNVAPIASLRRLPAIGPGKAAEIVAWRDRHGPRPFRFADDLDHVPQIGPRTVERVAHYLTLPRRGGGGRP